MDAAAFGRYLIEARLARDLTLDEAALQTHIRKEILAAIEHGDLTRIPVSPLQLRGMLRNYARFLRQNPEQILNWFDELAVLSARSDSIAATQIAGKKETGSGSANIGKLKRWRWLAVLLLLLLLVGVIAIFAILLIRQDRNPSEYSGGSQDTGITVTVTEDLLSATPTSLLFVTVDSHPADAVLSPLEGVTIAVEVTQRGWLNVTVDGVNAYDGLALAGEELAFEAESEIRLESANAAGVLVRYRDKTYSELGARGQLVALVFRQNEVQLEMGPGISAAITATEAPPNTATPIATEFGIAGTGITPTLPPTAASLSGNPTEIVTLVATVSNLPAPIAIPTEIPTSVKPTAILPPRTPMGLPNHTEQ